MFLAASGTRWSYYVKGKTTEAGTAKRQYHLQNGAKQWLYAPETDIEKRIVVSSILFVVRLLESSASAHHRRNNFAAKVSKIIYTNK